MTEQRSGVDPKGRVIEVWACPWVLRSRYLGLNARCGYVQNGPGVCPYDHEEDSELLLVAAVAWPPEREPEVVR